MGSLPALADAVQVKSASGGGGDDMGEDVAAPAVFPQRRAHSAGNVRFPGGN